MQRGLVDHVLSSYSRIQRVGPSAPPLHAPRANRRSILDAKVSPHGHAPLKMMRHLHVGNLTSHDSDISASRDVRDRRDRLTVTMLSRLSSHPFIGPAEECQVARSAVDNGLHAPELCTRVSPSGGYTSVGREETYILIASLTRR